MASDSVDYPTNLLWAHKLARQQAYLLERLNAIETSQTGPQPGESFAVPEELNLRIAAVEKGNDDIQNDHKKIHNDLSVANALASEAKSAIAIVHDRLSNFMESATEKAKCIDEAMDSIKDVGATVDRNNGLYNELEVRVFNVESNMDELEDQLRQRNKEYDVIPTVNKPRNEQTMDELPTNGTDPLRQELPDFSSLDQAFPQQRTTIQQTNAAIEQPQSYAFNHSKTASIDVMQLRFSEPRESPRSAQHYPLRNPPTDRPKPYRTALETQNEQLSQVSPVHGHFTLLDTSQPRDTQAVSHLGTIATDGLENLNGRQCVSRDDTNPPTSPARSHLVSRSGRNGTDEDQDTAQEKADFTQSTTLGFHNLTESAESSRHPVGKVLRSSTTNRSRAPRKGKQQKEPKSKQGQPIINVDAAKTRVTKPSTIAPHSPKQTRSKTKANVEARNPQVQSLMAEKTDTVAQLRERHETGDSQVENPPTMGHLRTKRGANPSLLEQMANKRQKIDSAHASPLDEFLEDSPTDLIQAVTQNKKVVKLKVPLAAPMGSDGFSVATAGPVANESKVSSGKSKASTAAKVGGLPKGARARKQKRA